MMIDIKMTPNYRDSEYYANLQKKMAYIENLENNCNQESLFNAKKGKKREGKHSQEDTDQMVDEEDS